jgi:hypothetical protein
MNHTAYEEDFIPWVETQAALLRDRKFDLLDIPNLYDELTSMASLSISNHSRGGLPQASKATPMERASAAAISSSSARSGKASRQRTMSARRTR